MIIFFFFFSSRRRHTRSDRDWSSDVCSSDLRRRSWLANLEADPHFTFHLKGSTRADLPATARIISDEAERRTVLTEVARAWRRNDVETMVTYSPLVEVTF